MAVSQQQPQSLSFSFSTPPSSTAVSTAPEAPTSLSMFVASEVSLFALYSKIDVELYLCVNNGCPLYTHSHHL